MTQRNRMVGAIVTVLLLLQPALLQAESTSKPAAGAVQDKALLTSLLVRLRQSDTVRVGFTQLKTVRILKRPLQSQGTLVFWRGKGMLWQVTAPVAATYVLNAQGMREVTQDGNSTAPANSSMQAATNSAAPNVLPLFDAIFAGDEAALAQHFDYTISGTPQQWQLKLTPRDDMLLRVFNRLELEGRDYIDHITLFDTRGDQTRIELHAPQFGSDKLSADEKSLLN